MKGTNWLCHFPATAGDQATNHLRELSVYEHVSSEVCLKAILIVTITGLIWSQAGSRRGNVHYSFISFLH